MLPLFVFVVGLSVGSFVNVTVFRFGFSERTSPRSRCMACDEIIEWYDLVPFLSYVMLRGRCRRCGSHLSRQYPLVELAVATLFLAALLVVPPTAAPFSLLAFTALLVFLAAFTGLVAYDLRHMLVPMPFAYVLIGAAFFAALCQSITTGTLLPLSDAVLGAISLGGFFLAIVLFTRGKGMGAGDVYVAVAIGLLLGFARGTDAIIMGVWFGTLVALGMLALSSIMRHTRLFAHRLHVTMKTELPLVPFLAVGTALALFTDWSPLAAAASLTALFTTGYL